MYEVIVEFIWALLGTLIGIGLIFVSFAIIYVCAARIDYGFDKSCKKQAKV